METKETMPQDDVWQQWEKEHKRGKRLGGLVIVIIGSLFLARELGVEFPTWLFTWKTALIAVGLFGGMKHGFRGAGWLLPIAIGGVYLISDLYPALAIKPLLWPLIVIFIGLVIIFKPHKSRHSHWNKWNKRHRYKHQQYNKYENKFNYNYDEMKAEPTTEDCIDCVAFMGGMKKSILTKHFKTGDITVIFSGAKIDFSQADLGESATLEVTEVFGGTQLIIPANWEIRSEMVCVFGNVEDKRPQQPAPATDEKQKLLILKGTIFFGGLEIKSF